MGVLMSISGRKRDKHIYAKLEIELRIDSLQANRKILYDHLDSAQIYSKEWRHLRKNILYNGKLIQDSLETWRALNEDNN